MSDISPASPILQMSPQNGGNDGIFLKLRECQPMSLTGENTKKRVKKNWRKYDRKRRKIYQENGN
jgi:hypothetical protein